MDHPRTLKPALLNVKSISDLSQLGQIIDSFRADNIHITAFYFPLSLTLRKFVIVIFTWFIIENVSETFRMRWIIHQHQECKIKCSLTFINVAISINKSIARDIYLIHQKWKMHCLKYAKIFEYQMYAEYQHNSKWDIIPASSIIQSDKLIPQNLATYICRDVRFDCVHSRIFEYTSARVRDLVANSKFRDAFKLISCLGLRLRDRICSFYLLLYVRTCRQAAVKNEMCDVTLRENVSQFPASVSYPYIWYYTYKWLD